MGWPRAPAHREAELHGAVWVAARRAREATWNDMLAHPGLLISSDLGVGHHRCCPPPFAPRHRPSQYISISCAPPPNTTPQHRRRRLRLRRRPPSHCLLLRPPFPDSAAALRYLLSSNRGVQTIRGVPFWGRIMDVIIICKIPSAV